METVPVSLIGGQSRGRSDRVSCQEAINVYFEQNSNGRYGAYGFPGLTVLGTYGSGPVRGFFIDPTDGVLWAVSVNELQYFSGTAGTLVGTVATSTGKCYIEKNSTHLCITDGSLGYTYAGGTFSTVTDADFPASPVSMTVLDGYGIVAKGSSGRFYISGLNNFATWDATDYATAESRSDWLNAVATVNRLLFLIGYTTTEVWANVGLADFPFQRLGSGIYDIGTSSRYTISKLDQNLYWLANNGMVVRSSGGHPERVSTHEIESVILGTDYTTATAFSFIWQGHKFYQLNLPSTSLVYDESNNIWSQRQSAASRHIAEYAQYQPWSAAYYFVDKSNGSLYTQSGAVYQDGTTAITKRIVSPHIENGGKRQFFSRLNVSMESSTSGTLTVDDSDDCGTTWNTARTQQFSNNMLEHRFSSSRVKTFRITSTSNAKFAVSDAWVDLEVGRD